jgi:precorrin-6B methylase 1
MKAFHYRFLTAATIVVGAAPALAQTPPAAPPAATAEATCEIDQNKPSALARATLSLTKANAVIKTGDPTKDLKHGERCPHLPRASA